MKRERSRGEDKVTKEVEEHLILTNERDVISISPMVKRKKGENK
jgi:hypothetical protein